MTEKTLTLDDFKIVLKEDGKLVGDLNEVKAAVQRARAIVAQVVQWGTGRSGAGNFERCMKTYFRVDPVTHGHATYNAAIRTVIKNLGELNISLQGDDLTLAPVEVTPATQDAAAYVRRSIKDLAYDSLVSRSPLRRAEFYGPLHLRFDQLFPVAKGAGNIVHEATHRYIGTRDWAYLNHYDLIAYEDQHTTLGVPIPALPQSPNAIKAWYGMTPDEAMNNADSYAGFVTLLAC